MRVKDVLKMRSLEKSGSRDGRKNCGYRPVLDEKQRFLKGLSKSKCEYLIARDRLVGEIQYWCNLIVERNFRK